jgi:AcrR family transcriptional regulator
LGRPQNANGQRTRQAILDAALNLFAEKGYFGTSLRDIATAVGVRESALYNYFPSKHALFEALIVAEHQSKLEHLSAVVENPIRDVRETLTRLALLAVETFSTPRQQQLFRILMSDGIRLARGGHIDLFEHLSSAQARLREVMIRLVSGGWLHAADPQLLMMEFMGPLFLWRQLRAIESPLAVIREPRRFARQHVDQFLRGAASATSDRPRRRVAARRRVSARDAAAEARRARNAGRPTDKRSGQ